MDSDIVAAGESPVYIAADGNDRGIQLLYLCRFVFTRSVVYHYDFITHGLQVFVQ